MFYEDIRKARIYYQDLSLNAHIISEDRAVLIPDKAVLIREIEDCDALTVYRFGPFADASLIDNEDRAGAIWVDMNDERIYPKYSDRSISVGDYIVFEDGEIWIVLPMGWDIRANNSPAKK